MSQLRAGGMALTTGLVTIPENNNKVVYLIEQQTYSRNNESEIKLHGWLCAGDIVGYHGESLETCRIQSKNLIPIDDGDLLPEDTKKMELVYG